MSLEDKIVELSRSVTLLTGDVQLLTAALKPFLEHLQKPVLGSNIVCNPAQDQWSPERVQFEVSRQQQSLINEREKEIVAAEVKAGNEKKLMLDVHDEATAALEKALGNESSTPVSGSQSEPETTKSFTYDDVKRATNALSAAKGKEVTIAALAHFGVTRATQLGEAQWGEYIAYCEKAAA